MILKFRGKCILLQNNSIRYVFKINNFKISTFTEKQKEKLKKLTGLPVVHHYGYVCELPPKHRFPMSKFHRVYNFLINDNVIASDRQVMTPCQVSKEVSCSVHTSEYIDKFFNGKTTEQEQKVTGFTWSSGLVSRVRYETGGTLLAAMLGVERGLACSTAGGTHHAFPDHGAGFCLINDLAITAQHLLDMALTDKVLIVDLDVHQGDGTAFIFKHSESVFTFSMHCQKNFPFRKQESNLDVPLDVGLGDSEYNSILQEHLPSILDSFRPGFVLYDAGVDPHEHDELGRLKITDKGLFQRDEYVLDQVVKRGIPVSTVIGGGYDEDIDRLALRHTIVHRAAAKVWTNRGL